MKTGPFGPFFYAVPSQVVNIVQIEAACVSKARKGRVALHNA